MSTLLILTALGLLAWLLDGGWPALREALVPDDEAAEPIAVAVGRDLGLHLACPVCGVPHTPLPATRGVPSPRPALDLSADDWQWAD